eukprot:COSAG05_NODE_8543_length_694_cov_1.522689_2_plen_138_part_01
MLARVQQQGLEAIGKADKTLDPAFDALELKFKTLCDGMGKLESALKLQQSSVLSNVAALGQVKFEVDRTFAFLPVENGDGLRIFGDACTAYDQEVRPKFDEVYEARVFGPLGGHKQKVAAVVARIKERNRAQLDYDAT